MRPLNPPLTMSARDVAKMLRPADHLDDKYRRGVVALVSGGQAYPGAGVLGVSGAWRIGAGMVRFEGSPRATDLVLNAFPETVCVPGRYQAAVLGSGWGDDLEAKASLILATSKEFSLPVVIDAGLLLRTDLWLTGRGQAHTFRVLTPHFLEAARLFEHISGTGDSDVETRLAKIKAAPEQAAAELSEKTDSVVVLKGAITYIADPSGRLFTFRGVTGWTGVAGSGDVLAGIIGGLLARAQADKENRGSICDLAVIAAASVWIHGWAAALAAGIVDTSTASLDFSESRQLNLANGSGHPIVASDIVAALPVLWTKLAQTS